MSKFARKIITDVPLAGKRVLIRVDFNVPMDKVRCGCFVCVRGMTC